VSWRRGGYAEKTSASYRTKEQKFERLANLKTNLILDGSQKLGSLSNKNPACRWGVYAR